MYFKTSEGKFYFHVLISDNFLCSAFYRNMIEVSKRVTCNQIVGIFGFVGEDHIGKYSFPPVQV